ncbi:hypothetical protein B0F90DRAFT_1822744 [Multifurca ochricompacta]|uniref:Uncharacterized protein n=1 Tax=Multifurca ochricompacta TaxID=376703 RepID=A0AAD4QJQ2_9AGAM|nr:hypothetical protein B0F90DRAFT_1822744 [Multifurca ochricompacta]
MSVDTDRHRYTHPGPPFVRNHVHSMHYQHQCIRSNEGHTLHARFKPLSNPRHPNPPISRFQQQLFDMEMPHTELVNTALDDLHDLRNSFRPPRQESPTRPTTLYTEWINTALDDLRNPGVWAEVMRFRTVMNDLDVAQQAVAAARKQIE